MTNYNQRLDEILDIFHNKMLALETITDPRDEPSDEIDRTFDDAKQALTSLIKEMVVEAKPGYDAVKNSERDKAIDQFEQNLLKALETLE
jgi:hypothetical protein